MFAVMPLERSIPSEGDVSGAAFDARIGDIACNVLMPRLPEKGWKVRPPTDHEDWSHAGRLWWGGGSYGVHGTGISIKALGLDFRSIGAQVPDADRSKDKVRSAGYPWLERLLDWLAVLHGEPAVSISIEAPLMFLEFDPDIGPVGWHEPAHRIASATWLSAIEKASKNLEAPFSLVLLHKAAQNYFEGDYRVAVINAATALELAVTAALERVLEKSSEPVLGQVRMLGPRLDLANKLGVPVPTAAQSRLLRLRNLVIHHAAVPDALEVRQALQDFVDVVKRLPESDLQ